MSVNLEKIKWFLTEKRYEEIFTYEERCEIFNEFQIPVSQTVFCPALSWVDYSVSVAQSDLNGGEYLRGSSYSHSGGCLSAIAKIDYARDRHFLKKKTDKDSIRINENTLQWSYKYSRFPFNSKSQIDCGHIPERGYYISSDKDLVYPERSIKFLKYFKML